MYMLYLSKCLHILASSQPPPIASLQSLPPRSYAQRGPEHKPLEGPGSRIPARAAEPCPSILYSPDCVRIGSRPDCEWPWGVKLGAITRLDPMGDTPTTADLHNECKGDSRMPMGSVGRKAAAKFWSEHILEGEKGGEERAFQAEGTDSATRTHLVRLQSVYVCRGGR